MHLQGSDSGHQNHHVGSQTGVSALYVEEFLHPDIGTKASLCHCLAKGTMDVSTKSIRLKNWRIHSVMSPRIY